MQSQQELDSVVWILHRSTQRGPSQLCSFTWGGLLHRKQLGGGSSDRSWFGWSTLSLSDTRAKQTFVTVLLRAGSEWFWPPRHQRWHLWSFFYIFLMISIKLRGFVKVLLLIRSKSKWVRCLLMCVRTAAIYSSVCPGRSFWSPWCCFSLLAVKSNTTARNSFPAFIYQQPAGIVAQRWILWSLLVTAGHC